jgi:hypothetical protein
MSSPNHTSKSRRLAHSRRHPQKAVPCFEQLEPRALLTIAPLDFLDRFVAEGSGGLATSRGRTFGPDVNGDGIEELYVSSGQTDAVLRSTVPTVNHCQHRESRVRISYRPAAEDSTSQVTWCSVRTVTST